MKLRLRWFIVSIAILGSYEETRVVCIRVCDTCDNAVLQQNRAMATRLSNLLRCLFRSFEIHRRSLVAARLKPAKNTTHTEAVEIRDQMLHTPFNVVEADLICAGVGEINADRIEEPHAPSMTATAVNAFEPLMRHGQAAHRQTQFISRPEASGWLNAGTAEGRLSLRQQTFLEPCSVGCSASHTPAARNCLFLAVNRVFWAVTPKLKKSLLTIAALVHQLSSMPLHASKLCLSQIISSRSALAAARLRYDGLSTHTMGAA